MCWQLLTVGLLSYPLSSTCFVHNGCVKMLSFGASAGAGGAESMRRATARTDGLRRAEGRLHFRARVLERFHHTRSSQRDTETASMPAKVALPYPIPTPGSNAIREVREIDHYVFEKVSSCARAQPTPSNR